MVTSSTLVDRVKIFVESSGTGPFELGNALPAFRGSEALVDGLTYSYAVENGSDYEAGQGVYVLAVNQFLRAPTISSNNGAPVAFPANVALNFTALADDLRAGQIGTGTVTSVNASGGTTGLAFTGGPIEGAGTLTLGGTLGVSSGGTGGTTPEEARAGIGLGNVDNTSDAAKPISTATQIALNDRVLKSVLNGPDGADEVGAGSTTLVYQIQATPAYYGIVDDPNAANPALAVNQATALQEWLTACVNNKWSPYAPHPIRVYSDATLTYNPPLAGWIKQANLHISNMLLYSSATTGFVVGSASTNVDFAVLDMPSVIRQTVDWSGTVSDLNAAVVIYSGYKNTINRGIARFFTKGYLFYSRSAGFSTNTINGGQMASNRYNEVFLCDGALGVNADYCNENNIFGADYNEFSTTQAITGNRYHTVFTAINGGYRGSNNNRFWGVCYQGLADAPSGQAIPIWFDGCGGFNNWYSPRWENGDGPFMYADAKAAGSSAQYAIYNEVVHKGYDGGTDLQQFRAQQVGGAFGNIYRGISTTEDTWQSGDLRDAIYAGGAAGVYRVKNGFYLNYTGPAVRELNLLSGFYNNIYGAQFSAAGIFARFDTTKIKNFLVQSGSLKGFEGRLFIEAFDAGGNRLTGTITDSTGTEMYVKSAGLVPSGNFGGGYNGQADNSENFAYIAVRDEVAEIGIAYVSGTKNIVCSNFSVRGFSTRNIDSTTVVSGGIRPINPLFDGAVTRTSAANPATAGRYGFYAAGQIVGNGAATTGQTSGWICTTAGALGWPFAINTAFAVPGQVVMCGASGERAYYVKTPGTTSGSGTGPTGTTPGTDYTDGSVVFRYISPKAVFLPLANIP